MDTEASHLVERRFLSLEDLKPQEKEFNVSLKIHSAGAWILKFRQSGIIYNRQDLVLTDGIRCEVAVVIKDVLYFHQIMVGEASMADEIKMGNITVQGHTTFVDSFLRRFPKSSHSNGQSGSSLNSTVVNASVPIRENRVLSGEEVPPIKAGWLLKKRDIISGWKCRYFEIYKDRLDYYADQKDVRPRGSYPLYGVEIGTVKPIRVKRRNEHYGLFLELRCPDKTIKLASERTGLEGKVEADSWFQAFQLAAAAADTSKSPIRRKSGTRGNLQSASRQANATNPNNHLANNSNGDARHNAAAGANASASGANAQPTTRRAVVGTVARNLMRKMSIVGRDNYLSGDEDNAPFSTLQLVLYGGVILLLAVAVWYAWYVAELLSRKTFITLAILLAVLVFIFVQECVLGDDAHSQHLLPQQQQATGLKQVDTVTPASASTVAGATSSQAAAGVIALNSDGDSSNDEDGDDDDDDDEDEDEGDTSDANSVATPGRNHSNEPQQTMNNTSHHNSSSTNTASVNRKLHYPALATASASGASNNVGSHNHSHNAATAAAANGVLPNTHSAPPQLQSPMRTKAIDELS